MIYTDCEDKLNRLIGAVMTSQGFANTPANQDLRLMLKIEITDFIMFNFEGITEE